jgi:predicted ribosome quality control (RQC) complex YloA/Tae2 family protein
MFKLFRPKSPSLHQEVTEPNGKGDSGFEDGASKSYRMAMSALDDLDKAICEGEEQNEKLRKVTTTALKQADVRAAVEEAEQEEQEDTGKVVPFPRSAEGAA